MGKTNFTKVEKSLEEGLIKISSRKLLQETPSKGKKSEPLPTLDLLTAQLQRLARDLKKLHTQDKSTYKKLGLSREKLKKLLANPALLTIEDWQQIKALRPQVVKLKAELTSTAFIFDDELVEKERAIQKNRRFNINEKWLPLK